MVEIRDIHHYNEINLCNSLRICVMIDIMIDMYDHRKYHDMIDDMIGNGLRLANHDEFQISRRLLI